MLPNSNYIIIPFNINLKKIITNHLNSKHESYKENIQQIFRESPNLFPSKIEIYNHHLHKKRLKPPTTPQQWHKR